MPLLARHEGVWDGTYTYFNAQNEKIDEHASRLLCRFPDEGPAPYHQSNYYTWADGKIDNRDFPAEFRDKRVWWDNELIIGWATEVPLDQYNRTVMLGSALATRRSTFTSRSRFPMMVKTVAGHGIGSGMVCWKPAPPFRKSS